MTHTAVDSLAWLSRLAVDLIALHIYTTTLLSVQFIRGCFRILNLKVSSHTDHSFPILTIARTYPSLSWRPWTAFQSPLPKKSEMLSQSVIDTSLFHVALFEVKVLLWARSRTKTSVSSEWITHVIPVCRTSMANHTRISFFVTELYLRNRVLLCCCVQSQALVFGCHTHMIRLPNLLLNAPVLPCGMSNLTISAYLW